MPDSTRFKVKKELNRAQGNISWALKHLARVEQEAHDQHPKIADYLKRRSDKLVIIWEDIETLNKSI
jgi:hypothetical protein